MPTSLLADAGHVLPERRQQLDDERDRGRHERGVEQGVAREDAVAQHGAPAAAEPSFVQRRGANPGEHDHVADERHAVDREEDGERLRIPHRRDQAGDDAADRDADVHREALQRVRGRASRRRRECRERAPTATARTRRCRSPRACRSRTPPRPSGSSA